MGDNDYTVGELHPLEPLAHPLEQVGADDDSVAAFTELDPQLPHGQAPPQAEGSRRARIASPTRAAVAGADSCSWS